MYSPPCLKEWGVSLAYRLYLFKSLSKEEVRSLAFHLFDKMIVPLLFSLGKSKYLSKVSPKVLASFTHSSMIQWAHQGSFPAQHRKPKQWEFMRKVLSQVQLKTSPLLLGILITFGAMMWPAPANLLIAVKQKAYIALLRAILSLMIPFLDLMSSLRFSSSRIILG